MLVEENTQGLQLYGRTKAVEMPGIVWFVRISVGGEINGNLVSVFKVTAIVCSCSFTFQGTLVIACANYSLESLGHVSTTLGVLT